jgi:hypothetical protein
VNAQPIVGDDEGIGQVEFTAVLNDAREVKTTREAALDGGQSWGPGTILDSSRS